MRHNRGITLVEMMVVAVIIGIICAIALPNFATIRNNAYKDQCIINLMRIVAAKEHWSMETGATDADIEEFKTGGPERVARFWMARWIEDLKRAGFATRQQVINAVCHGGLNYPRIRCDPRFQGLSDAAARHVVAWTGLDPTPGADAIAPPSLVQKISP